MRDVLLVFSTTNKQSKYNIKNNHNFDHTELDVNLEN